MLSYKTKEFNVEQKRILVVDANEAVHYDFRKALELNKGQSALEDLKRKLVPEHNSLANIYPTFPAFIIDSAYQGEEAVQLLKNNMQKQQHYALAFIDVSMPPGIDGITTIERLWEIDSNLQVVICTSNEESSYETIYQRLKGSDNFLILKKPFDVIEILQLVSSLTRKWELDQQARQQLQQQSDQLNYFFHEADFLYRLSQLSQTEFSTKDALQFYVDGICSLRNWSVGHIYRSKKNKEDGTISLHSSNIWYVHESQGVKNYQQIIDKTIIESGIGLPGRVLKSRTPKWIENLKFEEQTPQIKALIDCGLRGALAIPIKLYDKVIAIVEFFSEQPITHNQQLLDLTTATANQLGLLLERRRNEKELKANYQKLESLYKEMQSTQAQLLQHAKLVSIGQLAAGVAHEINNPIAFVTSNVEVLNDYMNTFKELFAHIEGLVSQNSTQKESWDEITEDRNLDFIISDSKDIIAESLDGLKRVKDIVSDLKTFSHTDEADIQDADINHCIDVTLKMIWNELKYKCTVIKDYGELPLLHCYARQLNQVFMNLLVNAGQAIEEQGEITITTRCLDDTIYISIKDSGEGIPSENMEHLFDPFFTTKPVGTGTGLGLSISYNIMKKHGGTIKVDSAGKGQGTTFTLELPLKGV